VAETDAFGDSLYNSLQAQLRHQFSKGLLLQVSYTWSKNMTNINTSAAGSGIQPPGEVIFGAANSNNPLDLRQQYGLAAFNRSQRAVISYVYSLPSGHLEGVAGKLASGWSLSGLTTNPGGTPSAPCGQPGSTFLNAGTGYGNSAIGSVEGPGQLNFDMALIKFTKVWEGGTLEFRMEAFNLFNHAQFNPPANDLNTASTFGIITSTSVTPRVMQFGLKLLF